jgi:hypothetical protein
LDAIPGIFWQFIETTESEAAYRPRPIDNDEKWLQKEKRNRIDYFFSSHFLSFFLSNRGSWH